MNRTVFSNARALFVSSIILVSATIPVSPSYAGLITPEAAAKWNRWGGTWDCKLDGRDAEIVFRVNSSRTTCSKGFCKTVFGDWHIDGWIRDISRSGAWQKFNDRKKNRADISARRPAHIKYFKRKGGGDMTLFMHTWDNNYITGYTIHRGTPYGIQCTRRF